MGELNVVPGEASGFDYESAEPLPIRPTQVRASDTSSLGTLRDRLRKHKAELSMTSWALPAGDGEPGILVEYRPIGWEELEGIRKTHKKAGPKQGINVATDILVTCCLGVYLAHDDDKDKRGEWEHLTEDEPTTFASVALGEFLSDPDKGLEVRSARQAVRNLYAADGDVVGTGDGLVRFSGYMGEDEANRPN